MTPPDTAGVEPEEEPLGGGAGDQQEDTERAGSVEPGPDDPAGGAGTANSDGGGGDSQAPEIAESEGLETRLEVSPERGDVKG